MTIGHEGTTGHQLNSAIRVKDLNHTTVLGRSCKNTKLDFLAVHSGCSSIQSISKVIWGFPKW
jgi:hypothetical protein